MTHWVPELLAPAGSLEKLKVAISYGADAVYLGGQNFGLRSAADNFTDSELREGVSYAHSHDALVYVVLNSFLHDRDLDDLPAFLHLLDELKVDAVIVSDLGVVRTVIANSNLVVHLSTQASCVNANSAALWKEMGVQRIVLGREVSIEEARKIKEKVEIEIEMFVHGSMCMAFSGNCVISNYTQGRDSNRGGCAHSCRFEYSLEKDNEKKYAFFMSSKDLQGLRLLEEFISAGIDSLKVEGRMKSNHYAATISKVYSNALDYYREKGSFLSDDIYEWEQELAKMSHRDYTAASLITPADGTTIYSERQHSTGEAPLGGVVLETKENLYTLVEVRSRFKKGSHLEIVPFKGRTIHLDIEELEDVSGEKFEQTRPGMLLKLPYISGVESFNIIRVIGEARND